MTLYMLDTNMVSYIVKGRSRAARQKMLNLGDDERCCISVITEAEIHYGLALRPEATELRSLMLQFLTNVDILSWDREEAQVYGSIRARLRASGQAIDAMDLMIAVHASSSNAVLVTNDLAFQQVTELKAIVNWAHDL